LLVSFVLISVQHFLESVMKHVDLTV